VSIIIFIALRVMPGDLVSVMFGTQATMIRPEERAQIEEKLGLSDPLLVQYGTWLRDIATGKLGKSCWRGDTVVDLIVQRAALTVEIAVMAIILSWVVGVPVGILSALRQDTLAAGAVANVDFGAISEHRASKNQWVMAATTRVHEHLRQSLES
jgi:peptide/nickel transport system permease protein